MTSYTKQSLNTALSDLRKGLRISEVSVNYNIPQSTLRDKINGKYADKKPGPATVLTSEEESNLVEWIKECCNRGFPVTKLQLIDSVKTICIKVQKKNPFRNNTPGRAWYEGFMKRHPDISQRVSENITLNRAKVSEYSLRQWFFEVKKYFTDNNVLNMEPNRIFNCDETGIALNPVPSTVLAPKGHKNVYKIVNNNEKENISVLVNANAAGELAPTLILFAGKSLPNKAAEMAPAEFAFSFSESGWMMSKNFYEYIANIFEPWLTKWQVKRPVLLYVDGHSSHMTLHLSQFCSAHQIILIALHPNATHICQPLDVSLFRTLKANWLKVVQNFTEEALSLSVQKHQFAPLLKRTFESIQLSTILKTGFKKCGLYPFEVNAIDYTKIVNKNLLPCQLSADNIDFEVKTTKIDSLKALENLLDEDQLKSFKFNLSPTWKGEKKYKALFEIWHNLAYPSNDNTSMTINNQMISESETIQNKRFFGNDKLSQLEVEDESIMTVVYTHSADIIDSKAVLFNEQMPLENNQFNNITIEGSVENEIIIIPFEENEQSSETLGNTKDVSVIIENKDNLNNNVCDTSVEIANIDIKTDDNKTLVIPIIKDINQEDNTKNDIINLNLEEISTEKIDLMNALELNTLVNINNIKENLSPSTDSIKQFLHWPDENALKCNKNGQKSRKKKSSSIVSGTQWQQNVKEKENAKRLQQEAMILKRKIKQEKQEKGKIDREQNKIKKAQERFIKDQQRIRKEKEALYKKQEKLKATEEKNKSKEEYLLKLKNNQELKDKIEKLQQELISNENSLA